MPSKIQYLTVSDQIEHLERAKAALEADRDRAITEAQRGIWDAHYAGANYSDVGDVLETTRAVFRDHFSDLLGPINDRLDDLRIEIGRAA